MNANKREFVLLWIAALTVFGQTQEDRSHFEVASIRPVDRMVPLHYTGPNTGDPARIAWARISLKELIQDAYRDAYPEYDAYRVQISGPPWIENQYSLTAKIPPGSTDKDISQMLRNLVMERFGLKFHDQSKNAGGFELMIGDGGFKLTPSTAEVDLTTPSSEAPSKPAAADRDPQGFPILTPAYSWRTSFDNQLGIMRTTFRQCSMKSLANMLSLNYTQGTVLVIDKTGINGAFDFHLALPVPSVTILPPAMAARMPSYTPPDDPGIDLRDISGTLEKQTGLKLKTVKLTLRIMVIDSVARTPTEN